MWQLGEALLYSQRDIIQIKKSTNNHISILEEAIVTWGTPLGGSTVSPEPPPAPSVCPTLRRSSGGAEEGHRVRSQRNQGIDAAVLGIRH